MRTLTTMETTSFSTLIGNLAHTTYKIIDFTKCMVKKYYTSDASAARETVADLNGDGEVDFATIGYAVEGYFLADKK